MPTIVHMDMNAPTHTHIHTQINKRATEEDTQWQSLAYTQVFIHVCTRVYTYYIHIHINAPMLSTASISYHK